MAGISSRTRPPAKGRIGLCRATKPRRAAGPMTPCRAGGISTEAGLDQQRIDGSGQGDIALAEAVGIVGGQADGHAVVAVGPIGMVPGFLRRQRHAAHEGEGFRKILELEDADDGLGAIVIDPALEPAQALLTLLVAQLLNHAVTRLTRCPDPCGGKAPFPWRVLTSQKAVWPQPVPIFKSAPRWRTCAWFGPDD